MHTRAYHAPACARTLTRRQGYNEINLEEMTPATGGYSGYGNRVQTPHLAQLARDGMVPPR